MDVTDTNIQSLSHSVSFSPSRSLPHPLLLSHFLSLSISLSCLRLCPPLSLPHAHARLRVFFCPYGISYSQVLCLSLALTPAFSNHNRCKSRKHIHTRSLSPILGFFCLANTVYLARSFIHTLSCEPKQRISQAQTH